MTLIEKKFRGNVEFSEKEFTSEKRVKDFEKVLAEFEELVKKRMVKSKGDRLFPITDAHSYFNGVN